MPYAFPKHIKYRGGKTILITHMLTAQGTWTFKAWHKQIIIIVIKRAQNSLGFCPMLTTHRTRNFLLTSYCVRNDPVPCKSIYPGGYLNILAQQAKQERKVNISQSLTSRLTNTTNRRFRSSTRLPDVPTRVSLAWKKTVQTLTIMKVNKVSDALRSSFMLRPNRQSLKRIFVYQSAYYDTSRPASRFHMYVQLHPLLSSHLL